MRAAHAAAVVCGILLLWLGTTSAGRHVHQQQGVDKGKEGASAGCAQPSSEALKKRTGGRWICKPEGDAPKSCTATCGAETIPAMPPAAQNGPTINCGKDGKWNDIESVENNLQCLPVCDTNTILQGQGTKDSTGGAGSWTWTCKADKTACTATCPNGYAPNKSVQDATVSCQPSTTDGQPNNFPAGAIDSVRNGLMCSPVCDTTAILQAQDIKNDTPGAWTWTCLLDGTACTATCPSGFVPAKPEQNAIVRCQASGSNGEQKTFPDEAIASIRNGFKCSSGSPRHDKKPAVGAIVGGVLGSVGGLCIIGAIVWFFAIRPGGLRFIKGAPGNSSSTTGKGFDVAPSGAYPIGRDPALVKRHHDRLRQAVEGFSLKIDACTTPDFWQAVLASAPGLGAIVEDRDRLSSLLLRHNVWCWLDRNLWSNKDALAACPPFEEHQPFVPPHIALDNYTTQEEVQQHINKLAQQMAQDLNLPAEEKPRYLQQLASVIKNSVQLKLALRLVDVNARMWVTNIDTASSTPQLLSLHATSQVVGRTLAVRQASLQNHSEVVALCLAPGSGQASRASGFEQEQVVTVQSY